MANCDCTCCQATINIPSYLTRSEANALYAPKGITCTLPRGYIDGMIMEPNTGTDPLTDILVNPGVAKDSINTLDFVHDDFTVKQLDATWAAGSDAGGRASAVSLTINTWYHVFAVDTSGGGQDFGFDTSTIAANLLTDTGGSKYRRIGSIFTDAGSPNIIPFIQFGDDFWWTTLREDFDSTIGTSATTITLSVPLGIQVMARVRADAEGTNDTSMLFTSPSQTDSVPADNYNDSVSCDIARQNTSNIDNTGFRAHMTILTNTSREIRGRATAGTNNFASVKTLGYIDIRGKNSKELFTPC